MRRRFFVEKFENKQAVVEGEAAHHLGRVLRAQSGQLYELSDGTSVWLGRIDTVSRDSVQFSLLEQLASQISPIETALLLSVVKFDSFEWALEKATELGVHSIVPLAAARSEKALLAAAPKRAKRWKKILLEASRQSRRLGIPALAPVVKPEAAFSSRPEGLRVLLSERSEAPPLRSVLEGHSPASSPVISVLAIGPEGGWTEAEFECAQSHGFREASLGRLILRTETAVVAALASLNYALGMD